MRIKNNPIKAYSGILLLLVAVVLGALIGLLFGKDATRIKFLGDIFLNLLFTAVVPVVFFSVASAVSGSMTIPRLSKIFVVMLAVFIVTSTIASVFMLIGVAFFPPAIGVTVPAGMVQNLQKVQMGDFLKLFTVEDFSDLFSRKNMLALMIVALLVGLSTNACGAKARPFHDFLVAGNHVMMKFIRLIMYYAPIGLCAYFAYLTGVFGPDLLGSYVRSVGLYYGFSVLYFFFIFSVYAYIAGGGENSRKYWRFIPPTALTAFATGSSQAVMPLNMEAAKNMGVTEEISEVVIPVGTQIHKEGSSIASIVKIALLFGLFGKSFWGADVLGIAILVAVLSGTVMGAIPNGGFIGELLIVTFYGFPPEALPIITTVGVLVDPPATMLNACSNNVCSQLVNRVMKMS